MRRHGKPAYFPVTPGEQAVLERIREHDLSAREDLVQVLDLIAESKTSAAELEQALALFAAEQQSEKFDARFEALEARLEARTDQMFARVEDRLRHFDSQILAPAPRSPQALPARSNKSGTPAPGLPQPGSAPASAEVHADSVLAFRIGDQVIQGAKGTHMYMSLWSWLLAEGHITQADLPLQGSRTRYLAAAEPIHPSGKPFFSARKCSGVYVETNMSRANMARVAAKLLTERGIDFEVLVGDVGDNGPRRPAGA